MSRQGQRESTALGRGQALAARVSEGLGALVSRADKGAGRLKGAARELRRPTALTHALAARQRGNLEAAFWLLSEAFDERPDDPEVVVGYWDAAIQLRRVDVASPAGVILVQQHAASGEVDLAAQYWAELVDAAPDVLVTPTALATILRTLRRRLDTAAEGEKEELRSLMRRAMRHAVDPRNQKGLGPGVALRLFEEGREVNPEAARRAAEVALDSPHLHEAKRARLEAWLKGEDPDAVGEPPPPAPSPPAPPPRGKREARPRPPRRRPRSLSEDEIAAAAARLPPPTPRAQPTEEAPESGPEPARAPEPEPASMEAAGPEPAGAPEPEPVEASEPAGAPEPEPAEPSAPEPARASEDSAEGPGRTQDPAGDLLHDLVVVDAVPIGISEQGLAVSLRDGRRSRVAYADIEALSVAQVGGLGDEPVIVIDLVLNWNRCLDGPLRVVRLRQDAFEPADLVPDPGAAGGALQALLAELLERSRAVPLPHPESALGLRPETFDSLATYQRQTLGTR